MLTRVLIVKIKIRVLQKIDPSVNFVDSLSYSPRTGWRNMRFKIQ